MNSVHCADPNTIVLRVASTSAVVLTEEDSTSTMIPASRSTR